MQSNKEEAEISNTNNWETVFPKHTHTYMNDGIMPEGDKTPHQSHEVYNENVCFRHGKSLFELLTSSPLENRALFFSFILPSEL